MTKHLSEAQAQMLAAACTRLHRLEFMVSEARELDAEPAAPGPAAAHELVRRARDPLQELERLQRATVNEMLLAFLGFELGNTIELETHFIGPNQYERTRLFVERIHVTAGPNIHARGRKLLQNGRPGSALAVALLYNTHFQMEHRASVLA